MLTPHSRSAVARIQRQLEAVYGLDRVLDADRYVLRRSQLEGGPPGLAARPASSDAGVASGPGEGDPEVPRRREALWVAEADGGVELALVLDDALADAHGPLGLDAFCAVAEGVSHLLYVALAVERRATVTALELELQAEIDKFALLVLWGRLPLDRATQRLFTGWTLDDDVVDPDERDRYRAASGLAYGFCRRVLTGLVQRSGVEALLRELRRVYRLTGQQKREYVAAA